MSTQRSPSHVLDEERPSTCEPSKNLDELLIIIEVEMRHEGKYTCSVATPQGVAMR